MNPYFVIIVAALAGSCILTLAADFLNLRMLSCELPPEFEGWYSPEKYRDSQLYLRDTTRFDMLEEIFNTALLICMIVLGGFNLADRIARAAGFGEILSGLLFAGILVLFFKLVKIPFDAYRTFVIEDKYGFNRTRPATFVLDIVKTLALTAVLGGIVFAGLIWFFLKAGDMAWLYCWVTVALFQLVIIYLAPYVIMPLFNKFEPMEEGDLKRDIEEYAKSQEFRIKGVFKMDGSRRSGKSNAFFTGIGSGRRIVLFDTLIEAHPVKELVAVVAHEMGHYKKKHIAQSLARSFVVSGLAFFLLSLFIENQRLFEAFRMDQVSIYASLLIFGFLYAPVGMAMSLAENWISRKHEKEADDFAAETSNADDMAAALKRLTVDNLGNLRPHPLKVFVSYSHPPVLERIRRLVATN